MRVIGILYEGRQHGYLCSYAYIYVSICDSVYVSIYLSFYTSFYVYINVSMDRYLSYIVLQI